jgi:2-hydroxychromene-2-carboxylate isomerase
VTEALEFVFSFRSPYAWIAARRVVPRIPGEVPVRWRPFYPLPSFENFLDGRVPGRQKYIIRDVLRLAKAYDLPLEFPSAEDPDWSIPHAAFLHADEAGKGIAFALEMFAARWERGEDLAAGSVIRAAAARAGLDADAVLAAGQDPGRRRQLAETVEHDYTEREIFGVPMILKPRGTRFWGHDRIAWALERGLLDSVA